MRVVMKRGNDQAVTLPNLRKSSDGSPVNDAIVKGTLVDSKGVPLRGYTNFTMTYITDSAGDYKWTVDGPSFMLPPSKDYSLIIVGVSGGSDYRAVHQVTVED